MLKDNKYMINTYMYNVSHVSLKGTTAISQTKPKCCLRLHPEPGHRDLLPGALLLPDHDGALPEPVQDRDCDPCSHWTEGKATARQRPCVRQRLRQTVSTALPAAQPWLPSLCPCWLLDWITRTIQNLRTSSVEFRNSRSSEPL